jgi:hypothetical protein
LPAAAQLTEWRFTGQHAGIEHFTVNTGRCPFLDHELEETFTLADGTTWSFRSEYCGTVDANGMWSGAGTFEITTGVGSGFAGTTSNSAQLPSVGEPYTLDVHSGTGEFAGATGVCALDNHLRTIESGAQEQWGTFVCDLHR